MARAHKTLLTLPVLLLGLGGPAFAQGAGAPSSGTSSGAVARSAPLGPPTAPIPTALPNPIASPAPPRADPCRVPGSTIALSAPLPRIARMIGARSPIKVLAIGSSSTAGVGASSPGTAYPAQLETELEQDFPGLDFTVLNRGVSGELAAATAGRIKLEAALDKPDLVVWQVGTNDALARLPVEEVAETVRETLRWLKESEIDAVLVGPQYTKRLSGDEHYRAMREGLKAVAAETSVPLIRRYDAMKYMADGAGRETMLASDAFHLNDLGYRCMATHIARGIIASIRTDAGDLIR